MQRWGGYIVSASLAGEYALAGTAPALEVLLDLGGGETYAEKYVSNWTNIPRDNTEIIEQDDGSFLMNVYVANIEDRVTLVQLLKNTLPYQIRGQGYITDGLLEAAGFIPEGTGYPVGRVKIEWNIEDILPLSTPYDECYVFSAKPVVNESGHRIIINSNVAGEANSDENPKLLSIKVVFLDLNLTKHTVASANPQNVRDNLFDYWVKTQNTTVESNGDILDKSDRHLHEEGGEGVLGTTTSLYSTKADWNQGINLNRLLLFGDGMIHAGLWNKGAGENCLYGGDRQENTDRWVS